MAIEINTFRDMSIYERFNSGHEKESALRLLEKLNELKKLRWEDIVEKMNFTYSSLRAWNLLKKCGTDAPQIDYVFPCKTHGQNSCSFNENINYVD
jgi:hypothetical protein